MAPELIEANRSSWQQTLAWIESLPDSGWREWKQVMRPILAAAVQAGLNHYFRAGQSVNHLIFSTSAKHGLEDIDPQPPRVTLAIDGDGKLFVAWSRLNIHFNRPDRVDFTVPDEAFSVLKSYLGELWRQTRPDEPIPNVVA